MLDYPQLRALLAIDETGTFEGSARELNVISFAVSSVQTIEFPIQLSQVHVMF